MKLFVDDIRECPKGWTLARTVTEAIRILAQFDVDEVSLDHDICHKDNLPPGVYQPLACGETFEAVAWYIRLMPNRPKVGFHTANPIGEKKMREILK